MRRSNVALHTRRSEMIAKLAKLIEAMFAPLARELARMPPQAFRSLLLPGF
jgi:hypothetical protein